MNDVVTALLAILYTKEALADFNKRVDQAMLELSAGDFSNLTHYFSAQEYTIIQRAVKSIEDLQAIRSRLAQVDVFTVQLGFRPSAFFEYSLQQKILKAIKTPCVVNIVTVKQLLGGATVDYQGVYRDFSLRSAIKTWREKRAATQQ